MSQTMSGQNLRTWGRVWDEEGNGTWVEVTTDANGFNDSVMLTTICQVLKLNLGESPFFANYGIPAQQTVVTQVFPDYYAAQVQSQFASAFASLTIQRVPFSNPPTYNVNAVAHSGAILNAVVPT
jgi:hypothetical protein